MRIKDPSLHPYSIEIGDDSIDLIKESIIQDKDSKNFGKLTERTLGYFNTVDKVIKKVIALKLASSDDVVTLEEFYVKYKELADSVCVPGV